MHQESRSKHRGPVNRSGKCLTRSRRERPICAGERSFGASATFSGQDAASMDLERVRAEVRERWPFQREPSRIACAVGPVNQRVAGFVYRTAWLPGVIAPPTRSPEVSGYRRAKRFGGFTVDAT